MRVTFSLLIVLLLFSCENEKTLIGSWKKCVSPTLANSISKGAKDSLENANFFSLNYLFKKDSSFVISRKGRTLKKGKFHTFHDSLMQLEFANQNDASEWYQLKSSHPDSIQMYSELGSITFLTRQ